LLVLGKPSLVEGVAVETARLPAQKPGVSGGRGELADGGDADRKWRRQKRRRQKRRRPRRLKEAPRGRRREDSVGACATEEPARRRHHLRSGRHISAKGYAGTNLNKLKLLNYKLPAR